MAKYAFRVNIFHKIRAIFHKFIFRPMPTSPHLGAGSYKTGLSARMGKIILGNVVAEVTQCFVLYYLPM